MNLLTIQAVNGEKIRSFLNYPNSNDALSAFHYTMSSAIANAEVSEVVCALINDKGKVCKLDSYIRPVEEEIND